MSAIGYRRPGDSGPLYNPERDYAYITPTLMRAAIERMETTEDAVDKIAWRKTNNITNEEICAVAEALADAQRDFVNAAQPENTFEAVLRRHDFFEQRPVVRQLLFATIGEVFCAAWFLAVREVSIVGQESPAQADMARFSAAVREFVNQKRSTTYDANSVAERFRMMLDVSAVREKMLTQQLRECQRELRTVRAQLATTAVGGPWKRLRNFIRHTFNWRKGG